MAITLTYVDPDIAADSGSGTIGDPYGDLQYALDSITRNATDGDQLNVKNGTDEILASPLDLTTYGTPTAAAPLIIRGYTSAANDGGIGGIDCNSSTLFTNAGLDYIVLWDLHLHNGSGTRIVYLDNYITLIGCEIENGSSYLVDIDNYCAIINCYFHDGSSSLEQLRVETSCLIYNCYFESTYVGFSGSGPSCLIANNIFDCIDTTSGGIEHYGANYLITNNTFYSSVANTYAGIYIGSGAEGLAANNYFEGFSGVGGAGIYIDGRISYINNTFYNNTDNVVIDAGEVLSSSGTTNLSASGLIDPSSRDFRAATTLRAASWPATFPGTSLNNFLTLGALQRKEPIWLPRLRGHTL